MRERKAAETIEAYTQRSQKRGVKISSFWHDLDAVLNAAVCLMPFMQCEKLFRDGLSLKGKTVDRRFRASGLRDSVGTPKISANHHDPDNDNTA